MISVQKENAIAKQVKAISFDQQDEFNVGVEGYDVYENTKGIRFSVVTYWDPET